MQYKSIHELFPLNKLEENHSDIFIKDFDSWNIKKRDIDKKEEIDFFFKEREIWWISLGLNVGFEQDGKGVTFRRPGLVIKKFNKHLAFVVPLSTKIKDNPYYVPCLIEDDPFVRMAIISQAKPIDSKRFLDKIGMADERTFGDIKNAFRNMF